MDGARVWAWFGSVMQSFGSFAVMMPVSFYIIGSIAGMFIKQAKRSARKSYKERR